MKVLLADDNITAQRMGSKILSEAGYKVVAVSNGAAAVKKIASEKPELIILDVYMPGYSGLEVCEKVKSAVETMRVPVLLTVTNMEPFNALDGNRVKADGVVVKPFEATDLLSAVKKFEEKLQSPESFVGRTAKSRVTEEFPEEVWEPAPSKPALPDEIANAPALGLDELQAIASSVASPMEPIEPLEQASGVVELPAELEVNASPEVDVAPAAELQPTLQESEAGLHVAQDPALATDPSDFSEFVTKFGQEHPEDIPVGIAMEEPAAATDQVIEGTLAEADPQHDAEPLPVGEEEADGVLAHEQSPGYAEAVHDSVISMEEAIHQHEAEAPGDRIFALEPTMHDAAIAEIQSLIGEFMHHAETGFTFPKPTQQVIEASASPAAVATAPESEAEAVVEAEPGTDTQPVDVWPQMHPAALRHEPEVRTYEAHEESPAEVGVDTQRIEVVLDSPPEVSTGAVLEAAEITSGMAVSLPAEDAAEVAQAEPASPEAEVLEPELEAELPEPDFVAPQVEATEPESVATEAALPSAPAVDEERIASAVEAVLERYKSELIAAIMRELKN